MRSDADRHAGIALRNCFSPAKRQRAADGSTHKLLGSGKLATYRDTYRDTRGGEATCPAQRKEKKGWEGSGRL